MSPPTRVVAFLGPEGTFTAEAAERAAPAHARQPLASIDQVVAAVRDGTVDVGVVPIENSIEGSVNLTLDALAFGPSGAYVRGEVTLPISMNLLAGAGVSLADVKVVRSQPHALAQCRGWLSRHLPGAAVEAATSTAEAARQAAEAPGGVAAIATTRAAARYGLAVLAADIHDHPGNTTRFFVLGRALHARTGADKTSLVVFFGEDRPGLLLRTLEEFVLRGINLTKIESRPTKQALGEYCIFIDCAGHVSEPRLAEALRGVHRHVSEVRVLGCYPRADGVQEPAAAADSEEAYRAAAAWYGHLLGLVDEPAGD